MHKVLAGILALLVLGVMTVPANAGGVDGEFKSGWNTWETSVKGDMVKYAIGSTVGKSIEILDVDKAGMISYAETVLGKDGKPMTDKDGNIIGKPKTRKKAWQSARMMAKPPRSAEIKAEWTTGTYEKGDIKLECVVYAYDWSGTKGEIWYSKEVPCGGIVQQTSAGKASVWLTEYISNGKAGKAGDVKEADIVSQLPKFYAKVGNYIVVKISSTGKEDTYQKREVVKVEETSSTVKMISNVKADGTEKSVSTSKELESTKEALDKRFNDPQEENVVIKVAAGEFKCILYKSKTGTRETTTWMNSGVPIKLISAKGGKETVIETVKISWAK